MNRVNRVTSSSGPMIVKSVMDGKDHINIYSHSTSAAGRILSNFSRNPFTHHEFGTFESMEGFWYWYSTGCKFDLLRKKWGVDAKTMGRQKERVSQLDFEQRIVECIHCMLRDNPKVYDLLLTTTLPFTHYYAYGNTLKDNPSSMFMLTEFDLIRNGKPLMFP